jgi:peptidyl-prolyl cis-trans isomerase SurA
MTFKILTIALGLAALIGSAQAQGFGTDNEITVTDTPDDPRVRKAAAMVNGAVITDLDLDQRLALVITAANTRVAREEIVRLRGQVLRNLIDEKLQIAEAKEHDVSVEEAQVADAFKRYAQNFRQTPEQFETFLKSVGTSRQSLYDQIRAELSWNRLIRRRVEPFVNVGDDEVNAMIRRLESAKGQDEFRVSEIFVPATEENAPEVQALMNNILNQVRAGASFVTYVRQYSQSATAAFGGDKGYVQLSQLAPELSGAIQDAVAPADTRYPIFVGPVRAGSGYYLISVGERRKILGPDPLDASVTVKQISMPMNKETPREQLQKMVNDFAARAKVTTGCGRAAELAAAVGGKASDLPPTKIRDLPEGLHQTLVNLQIGQSTTPFGTEEDARVLMLCGRDEAQEAAPPSYDEVFAQINEERVTMMARRYLRDLRRDAIVDYR